MLKKTGIAVAMLMVLAACKPNGNQIARDMILRYGEVHYKHYQPIEFAKATEYYTPYERSKQYLTYAGQQKALKQQHDSLRRLIAVENKPAYLLQANIVDSALTVVDSILAQGRLAYKPERRGWMVEHQYNQQGAGGAMVRNTTVFIVDENLKNIIETYDK